MISADAALTGSYDRLQVALSALIAVSASYAALDLAGRVTAANGWVRSVWLTGGSVAMGLGIWSMHFVAMLAFSSPVPVDYNWPTVLAALLAGIISSAFALYVVSRQKMGLGRALAGSVVLGGGIAALHYIGMAAMRMEATCRFNVGLVILSVVFAIVFSLAALILAFDLREETRGTPSRKLVSAIVMGAAISAMHYTGLASASFMPSAVAPNLSHATSISSLETVGIGIVTLIVLGVAILTSAADRRLSVYAQELEQRVDERTSDLSAINAALVESEERFRRLVEALPDALYVHSEGRIVFVNSYGMRLLGAQQPEQLVGKGILEIVHPGHQELIRQRIQRCYETGTASSAMECVLVELNGSLVEVESAGIPITWKGSPAIEVVARDIRERKRAEEELRQAQTRTESVLESMADTHILFDRDWHYLYVNRAATLAMGRLREQILGRTLWELYPDIVGTELERQYRRAMEECLPVGFDFHYPTTNTWWENRFYPVSEGLSVFATDITERKRAEQSLQEAQAELAHVTRALVMGELVASIAHEVNQPLTGIVINGNFALRELASGTPSPEKLREAIAEIVEDGTRASAVISRIRALLEKGAPARVELDINEVIQEVSIVVRNEATRSRVSVGLDLASDLPRVLSDRVELQQVLINLAMNGIDAMRTMIGRPRQLVIRSSKNATGVLIQVQDSGKGFDPDHVDRIFEPFFTTKPQGIGMGLSISRSIIQSHGGRLWAETGSDGALLQFTLPTNGNSAS